MVLLLLILTLMILLLLLLLQVLQPDDVFASMKELLQNRPELRCSLCTELLFHDTCVCSKQSLCSIVLLSTIMFVSCCWRVRCKR
jgi:hypothetical protein